MDRYSSFAMNVRIILRYQCDVFIRTVTYPVKTFSVNRLIGYFSPVSAIRAIVSSVWKPVDKTLRSLLRIPGKICSFCSNCASRAISPFIRLLAILKEPTPQPNLPLLLTGVHDPTCKQIADSVKVLHTCTINTILNQISQKNKLQEYRNELQKWKEENEKNMADLFTMNDADKIAMKTLALSVKRLKVLKAKKSKYTKVNNEKMLKVVNKDSITPEDLKIIHQSHKNLNDIESEMSKNKKDCLDIVKTSEKFSHLFTKALLHSDSFYDYTLDMDLPLNTVNKLRAITYRSQTENDVFKSTLLVTNEKLDKILCATEKISTALADFKEGAPELPKLRNELMSLRSQLEQDQLILKNVTGERDVMRVKLDVLEDLIEDQENFLNSLGNHEIEETNVL